MLRSFPRAYCAENGVTSKPKFDFLDTYIKAQNAVAAAAEGRRGNLSSPGFSPGTGGPRRWRRGSVLSPVSLPTLTALRCRGRFQSVPLCFLVGPIVTTALHPDPWVQTEQLEHADSTKRGFSRGWPPHRSTTRQ